MKKVLFLSLVASMAIGCGDDDTPTPMVDATVDTAVKADGSVLDTCPSTGGNGVTCCFRESNKDKTTAAFRMAGLEIKTGGLANLVIKGALNAALQDERFNWLVELNTGSNELRTGLGLKNADNSFSFTKDAAFGDPPLNMRWNPTTLSATVNGSAVSTDRAMGIMTVPVFNEGADLATIDPADVSVELPLQGLKIENLTMSQDNSCVGSWDGAAYTTTDGELTAYLGLAHVADASISASGATLKLCDLLAGTACKDGDGNLTAQSTWMTPPNAACDAGTCTDTCDGDACNAWKLTAAVAAHGVMIK